MKYKIPMLLGMLALALACVTIRDSSAHEGEEEDTSPIPVTLGATWQAILKKQAELQGATASQTLPIIHKLAFRMRDLCNTLPEKSRDLSPDKLARVAGAVKNVARLSEDLDKTGDTKNQAGTEANLKRLDGVLKLIASQYNTPAVLADVSKEPAPNESAAKSKEHAHSDHESKRGGVLMMKDDWHIEGVQVDNEFRVYFFNEYTRPVPVGKITGKLVLPLPGDAKPDAEQPTTPLRVSTDGMYLYTERPLNYPDDFLTVRLVLDGQEGPFGFPIFKTTAAACGGCGTTTIAGPQAVSACGMCAGKLTPAETRIACSKCKAPVSYNAALLNMPPAQTATLETSNSAPKGESEPLPDLLNSYLNLQKALAADDFQRARIEASELAKKAGGLAEKSNESKFTAVAQGGQAIAEAKDIKQGRKAFGDLSQALIEQLGKTPPARGKYYILHCPMAKVGNGDWIQANPVTTNPYFGREMLTCGSVKKELK